MQSIQHKWGFGIWECEREGEIMEGERTEILNAKIVGTSLTMKDYGCLTFYVTVEGAGWVVSLGGYCIGKGYLGADEFTAANGNGLEAMMRIMDVVGVETWEDLEGKYCRVKSGGWGDPIHEIGNILKDKWFDIGEFFQERKNKFKEENHEQVG